MATETPIQHLTINKLTKAQYDSAAKSDTELYFITDSGLDALLDQKNNAGKYLKTDGTKVSWEPLIPDYDNETITVRESDNKLVAKGTLNNNTLRAKYDWVGTLAEYEEQNIATEHPDYLCYITDDYNIQDPNTATILEKLNEKADDQNLVHITEAETITGAKIFNNIRFRNNLRNSHEAVTSLEDVPIIQTSLNVDGGIDGASIVRMCHVDGAREVRYRAGFKAKNESKNLWPAVRCGLEADDTPYVKLDSTHTANTDNSSSVATTAHVINVLKLMYPVGSVYIGTQSTCPMGQLFGTWTLVSSGKALWTGTGSNANTTINAGLPNITGTIGNLCTSVSGSGAAPAATTGAFGASPTGVGSAGNEPGAGRWIGYLDGVNINASRSSSLYGKSSTVQPPAYVVNVWRRTA